MKCITAVLIVLLLIYPIAPALSTQEIGVAQQALLDARRDAENEASIGQATALGFFCGIIGVGIAYFTPPTPPIHRLMGKSPEYVSFYMDEYRRVAHRKEMGYAITGWVFSVACLYFLYAIGSANSR